MGTIFNWFKSYKIEKIADGIMYCCSDEYRIDYIGGGNTTHSSGNIGKVQDLIEKYSDGKSITSVCEDWIEQENYKIPNLIEPKEMSEICERILLNREVDAVGMRERIEWFKQLSDDGYYLTYDYQ